MEDSTLKKYFDDFGEKLDVLTKTIEKIDDRQSKQFKTQTEQGVKISYIEKESLKDKAESEKRFDIVHEKFRRGEANTKWWVVTVIALSSFVSGLVGFFYTKPG